MEFDREAAWIDESIHVAARAYILAAVVAEQGSVDQARARMRSFLRGRRNRVHWREMSEKQQLEIAAAITGLGVRAVAVVATNLDPRKQERARRKCLERLAQELDRRRIVTAWVESRGSVADRRDIRMVDAFRTRGTIGPSLRVGFLPASADPMLWIADVFAGALSAAKAGATAPREVLGQAVEQVTFDL